MQNVVENIDNISGKLKEKLLDNREMAFLSKTLATIKVDCDLDYELKDFEYSFPFDNEVHKFFRRYQFNSLLKKPELFAEITPDEVDEDVEQVLIENLSQVDDVVKLINKENMIKKPKFMCCIFGYNDSIVQDPETGIYILRIVTGTGSVYQGKVLFD
mgnify:CR=1 FL=1